MLNLREIMVGRRGETPLVPPYILCNFQLDGALRHRHGGWTVAARDVRVCRRLQEVGSRTGAGSRCVVDDRASFQHEQSRGDRCSRCAADRDPLPHPWEDVRCACLQSNADNDGLAVMTGQRWIRYTGLLLLVVGLPVVWHFGSDGWRQSQTARALATCRDLRARQKWPELAEQSRVWSQWSPKDADGWLFRALAAQNLGDITQAMDFLAQVDAANSKFLPSQLALAELLFGVGNRPLEGERVCRLILDKEPRAAQPHQWLIEFYATTLQKQKLLAQIRAASRVQREPPEAYVFAFLIDGLRVSTAVETNARWLEADPDEEIFLVAQALNSVEPASEPAAASDASAAAQVDSPERQSRAARLKILLQRFPQNIELLAHHIERAMAEGELENVIRLLQAAPAAADADNRFWRYRGWVQLQSGELEAARQSYDQALALAPLDWVTRHRRVALLRLQNEVGQVEQQQAIVDRARALRVQLKSVSGVEPVTKELINAVRDYARLCGDDTFIPTVVPRASSQGGRR